MLDVVLDVILDDVLFFVFFCNRVIFTSARSGGVSKSIKAKGSSEAVFSVAPGVCVTSLSLSS